MADGLHVHRSERADPLVAALGAVLATPLPDPFDAEIVAVPSRGIERWLAQQLSHVLGAVDGDGVCANVAFPPVSSVLDEAAAAADEEYAASVERWAAERAVWPFVRIVDEAIHEPWAAALAVHLGIEQDKGRRVAVASKLAGYFSQYGMARPAMVRAWHAGDDSLPPDLAWQAELWRRLRAELGASPAELLTQACAALRSDPSRAALPQRLSIFGTTRLPVSRIEVLHALAEHREVHLWLHHPSPALWAAPHAQVRNPLLGSLARDIRGLQQLLGPPAHDEHHAIPPRPDTVLGRLQTGLADDTVPSELAASDRSLAVHACHGPARQVEVLREAVLQLLKDDPTLEPRDIVIMCPDVETFAPLIAASFGTAEEDDGWHPATLLRVKLADRSLRQTNPLLGLLDQLLDLAADRITATQVLDLAGLASVRRRFGFTDDDLERLRDWTSQADARWGLDTRHRAQYHLGNVAQGTWRTAIDRLLLGVAMDEHAGWLDDVLPVDDVDSGAIALAGRFAELIDRLDTAVLALEQRHPLREWTALLAEHVLALGEPAHAWQEAQLRGELDDIAEAAGETDVQLSRADVAGLLHARLAGRPTRASFRTGTLTVCTLVPMRSVPHRVVCLLGLDDGVFPRRGMVDGDDVLARDPQPGERDVRTEDRQLFLDAICAAQEHLVITYTGADPRTGMPVPPCVPLGELLDAVGEHVVVHHPLQPFDERNFAAGALGTSGPFSFDTIALAGARAMASERRPTPPLVASPLHDAAAGEVELDELLRFVKHPVRGFLQQRLELSVWADDDEPADALPVEVEGLKKWAVGDRVLRNRLAGMSADDCRETEHRRGSLPPGRLGREALHEIGRTVDDLLGACELERQAAPESVDIDVTIRGRRLVGTVSDLRGTTLLALTYSTLGPKPMLDTWLRYLAVVGGTGRSDVRAAIVGRRPGGVRRALLGGVDVSRAHDLLGELIALRDEGLRAPLPMALKSSEAYAAKRESGGSVDDALYAAGRCWVTQPESRYPDEDAEVPHMIVWGPRAPLATLTAEPSDSHPEETTRFGALARRLWQPIFAAGRIAVVGGHE